MEFMIYKSLPKVSQMCVNPLALPVRSGVWQYNAVAGSVSEL